MTNDNPTTPKHPARKGPLWLTVLFILLRALRVCRQLKRLWEWLIETT